VSFAPSAKTVAQKLGIGEGARLLRLGRAPALELPRVKRVRQRADVVLVSVTGAAQLARVLEGALAARSDGGRLWLCYDKAGAVSRAEIGAVLASGRSQLTWFRQVALPEGWSAIWVKRRAEFKTLNR
jgi:hypothetical protein